MTPQKKSSTMLSGGACVRRKANTSRYVDKRLRLFEEKFMPEPNTGCWLWTASLDVYGYGVFWGGERIVRAHRFAFLHYVGAIPDDLHVLHKCDMRLCVNPEHLFPGTNSDNVADRQAKGRTRWGVVSGEMNGRSKLVAESVLAIRSEVGLSNRRLAAKYGVDRQVVRGIRRGDSWKHLPKGGHDV